MIQIYNGTLTSKERVLRTFNDEKADRVPIGYFANPGIQSALRWLWAYRRTRTA